jgi:hypothetical protein
MRILDELQQSKGTFGREAERKIARLLERLAVTRFRASQDLIQLHEAALFLRAFPQSARVARLADRILLSFPQRLRGMDLDVFDDPKVSGIAGTAVSTNFSYEFASSLIRRHGDAVSIDWENYERPDRLGSVLARLLPEAQEVYAVEPYVDWRRLFEDSGRSLDWLLKRVDPRTYDLLEIPLRWEVSPSASRSGLGIPREPFYHRGPFIKRSEVSLEAEFSAPPIRTSRVPAAEARRILAVIVDASAARYRELWGFVHPEENGVHYADLGRGVDLYFFGVAKEHRLPLRAYTGGMFFTNGVPTGYVEGLSRRGRMEIGFNLYYTFREGETAWVFARILKVLRQAVSVTSFSVDPYQLGHHNEEGIDSGAFWFYRKLGFVPATEEIARLLAREEERIAAVPGYRSSGQVLRRLATAPLVYAWRTLQRAAASFSSPLRIVG